MPEIFGAALMGGGSGPAYAAIGVTYSAGATCTCALGSKTFTAPDTSGQALFIVPTAGQWVVTISQSGYQPRSQTVDVVENKAYTVELSFALYLYNTGDENSAVTGGWSVTPKGINANFPNATLKVTLTKNSNNMSISVPRLGQEGAIVSHGTAVDFTPYTNVKFKGSFVSEDNTNLYYISANCWSPSIGTYWNSNVVAQKGIGSPRVSELALDISEVNGMGFVGFGFFNKSATLVVNEIVLE